MMMEALPGATGRPARAFASVAISHGQVFELWMAGAAKSLATTLPVKPFFRLPVKVVPCSEPLLPVVSVGVNGPMTQLKPMNLADADRLALSLTSAEVNPDPLDQRAAEAGCWNEHFSIASLTARQFSKK